MRPPDRGRVGVHRVGRQVEDVAVAAGGEDDRVREVGVDPARDQVPGHDAAGPSVHDDQVQHLGARVQFHVSRGDLPGQRLVGAEQQLLARLAAGVEGAGDLDAAEGAGVEQAAVLAGEGHALRHALVDDLDGDLREAGDVGLAGTEVAALDGVVEQPVDRVAVVAVVLRRVDAALRRDGVGTARGVLVAELDDVVACSARVAPADPPARPVPTTMTVCLRRLAGLTSLAWKRRVSQRSWIGPSGALVSAIGSPVR